MKSLRSILAAGFAATVLTVSAFAADPTGTWKWSVPGRDGQARETTAKLELKDGKLTGSMAGRQGGETPISDATFKDDTVAFSVVREFNGNKMTSKYTGKLEGDTIKGSSERPGRDGGAPQKSDWVATRAK